MTLEDEADDFIGALRFERAMSENTCAAYARDLARFGRYIAGAGVADPREITREMIVGFLGEERASGMAGATRLRRTAALRMFFRFMKERRRIDADPTDMMDPQKKERHSCDPDSPARGLG